MTAEEFERALAELTAANAARELPRVGDSLRRFAGRWKEIASDDWPRLRARLSESILLILRHAPREEFVGLLALDLFDEALAWRALAGAAPRWTLDEALVLVERFGLPPDTRPFAEVRRELATGADARIRAVLAARLRAAAVEEARAGEEFSARWRPWARSGFFGAEAGTGEDALCRLVRLVGERPEPEAGAELRALLRYLPWGEDRAATLELSAALARRGAPEDQAALRGALAGGPAGAPLRVMLGRGLAAFSRADALDLAVGDLGKTPDTTARWRLLGWLDALAGAAPGAFGGGTVCGTPAVDRFDRAAVARALLALDTAGWAPWERGALAQVLRGRLGHAGSRGEPWDRISFTLWRAFQRMRIDHLGCAFLLPALGVLTWAVIWGLDELLGTPSAGPTWVEAVLLFGWLAAIGLTASTPAAQTESVGEQVRLACGYWAVTVAAWGFVLLCHLEAWSRR